MTKTITENTTIQDETHSRHNATAKYFEIESTEYKIDSVQCTLFSELMIRMREVLTRGFGRDVHCTLYIQ